MMKITIEFNDKEMNMFLAPTGMTYLELSDIQKAELKRHFDEGIKSYMIDASYEVFEDYVRPALTG